MPPVRSNSARGSNEKSNQVLLDARHPYGCGCIPQREWQLPNGCEAFSVHYGCKGSPLTLPGENVPAACLKSRKNPFNDCAEPYLDPDCDKSACN